MTSRLTKAEAATAVLLTIAAISLRVLAAFSAGALWRDEANTVGLATLPSITEVWNKLQFDSFPIFWILLVRWISTVAGPMNDVAFRALGLAIGIAIVASLWWYARGFRYSFPLVSLAFLALSPTVIVWGDSMRGLGAGMLFIIVTGLLLWKFLERPTLVRFAFATLAAVASVQTLFYNSVFVLAFCTGAIAVCIDKNDWKAGAGAVGAAGIAALSIIPYSATIRDAASWTMVVRIPSYTFARFWNKIYETVEPGGPWAFVIWLELLVFVVIAAAYAMRNRKPRSDPRAQRQIALYSVVTLLAAWPAFFFFLRALSYPTRAWYYLTLFAVSAICADAIAGSVIQNRVARIARLVAVLIVGSMTFVSAARLVSTRFTNVDSIAARVEREAARDDFIIVTPWYQGVTFARYYRGATPWATIPPVEFHRYHRYDLIKQKMMMTDQHAPVASLEAQIAAALQGGRRVFVVGNLPVVSDSTVPVILPPAPLPGNQWPQEFYEKQWSSMIARFLQAHAIEVRNLSYREATTRVNEVENDALTVVTGWRP